MDELLAKNIKSIIELKESGTRSSMVAGSLHKPSVLAVVNRVADISVYNQILELYENTGCRDKRNPRRRCGTIKELFGQLCCSVIAILSLSEYCIEELLENMRVPKTGWHSSLPRTSPLTRGLELSDQFGP